MKRFVTVCSLFLLVVVACGDSTSSSTTTTPTVVSTPQATTTTTAGTSTTVTIPTTTTTTAGATTTSEETTTTTLAPVTNLPGLPTGVLSRSLVPWSEVDEGWVVVRYDGTDPNFTREGPWILYLVDPAGPVYEIRSFEADSAFIPGEKFNYDFPLGSLTNDGTHVYLFMNGPNRRVAALSLRSGLWQTTLELEPGNDADIGSTLPTGVNVVVSHWDSITGLSTLDLYYRDGSLFASIHNNAGSEPIYDWLYGLDGTTITMTDGTPGFEVYSNQGVFQTFLTTPTDTCRPVRWWDSETILAACVPNAVAAAGGVYEVLWLVPFDGSAPTQLTANPPPGVDADDPGHGDAWRAGGRVLLQSTEWCSPGWQIEELGPGTTTTPVTMPTGVGEPWIVAQDGDNLVVWSLGNTCMDGQGSLHVIAPDGTLVRTLIPRVVGAFGVVGVAPMIATP